MNNKCLQYTTSFCHNLEYFKFVCKPEEEEDEEVDHCITQDLSNILKANKNLKFFTISYDIFDDTILSELGTYCPLLQSLTIVSNNDYDYLQPNFDYFKAFTEGCRNLKYLDIQPMLDCQNNVLKSLGTNCLLLEVLRLVQDCDFNETDFESSSFQCLFKRCPLLTDITLTRFDIFC